MAALATGIVATAATAFFLEQYYHYITTRPDTQSLLHSPDCVHFVVLLKHSSLQEVLDGIRAAVADFKSSAKVVYEGEARFPGSPSQGRLQQFYPNGWDGCAIIQVDSKADVGELRNSVKYSKVIKMCEASYHVVFKRNRDSSLFLPGYFGFLRLRNFFTGVKILPFKVATPEQMKAGLGSSVDGRGAKGRSPKLPPMGELSRRDEPTVVVNFDLNGPKTARKANREYGNSMMPIFAELRTGPISMGKVISEEDGIDWDGVVVVHYPTWELFRGMIGSTAWNGVSGNKQLGDHFAFITNPFKRSKL